MKTRTKFGLGTLGAALVGGLLGGGSVFGIRSGYEEAAHEVLFDDGKFEVRQYEDALVARTVTTGDLGEAGSAAFRRLGGYIFGKNVTRDSVAMTTPVFQEEVETSDEPESESIAMTTPVFQEEPAEGTWVQTFVLPREYTMETLPVPTDPNVELAVLPGLKVAVVRYSGLRSTRSIEEQTERLRAWMAERDLVAT
ncbi:heme-binding protein, partial [bacterium]|nr:heme-binding protein [bacterium]